MFSRSWNNTVTNFSIEKYLTTCLWLFAYKLNFCCDGNLKNWILHVWKTQRWKLKLEKRKLVKLKGEVGKLKFEKLQNWKFKWQTRESTSQKVASSMRETRKCRIVYLEIRTIEKFVRVANNIRTISLYIRSLLDKISHSATNQPKGKQKGQLMLQLNFSIEVLG